MIQFVSGFIEGFSAVAVIISLLLMHRTKKVAALRKEMIHKIGDLCHEDIHKGYDPMWRWDEYDRVSFDQMIFSLKKINVKSFYDNQTFLQSVVAMDGSGAMLSPYQIKK